MQPIQIRQATSGDAEVITAFNIALAEETEGKTLDAVTVTAGVYALLERPQYGFYVVAEQQEQIVGSLLITFEWSDWRNGVIWWIQSVYVHPDCRRQGVFRHLYAQVQAWAQQEEGVCGLRLYVEEANHKAQATYRTLGMEPTGYQVFEALF
ncbi:MAG TPA: GNAT family N-acetyltransferase [Leptolyngbyaceae cyanobacterium]